MSLEIQPTHAAMGLIWRPFTPDSRPPKTTCFFSDGVAKYWVGWWSSERRIYIPGPQGNEIMGAEDLARVRWWAHPGNFLARTGRS